VCIQSASISSQVGSSDGRCSISSCSSSRVHGGFVMNMVAPALRRQRLSSDSASRFSIHLRPGLTSPA
jgi:hypothetical protein